MIYQSITSRSAGSATTSDLRTTGRERGFELWNGNDRLVKTRKLCEFGVRSRAPSSACVGVAWSCLAVTPWRKALISADDGTRRGGASCPDNQGVQARGRYRRPGDWMCVFGSPILSPRSCTQRASSLEPSERLDARARRRRGKSRARVVQSIQQSLQPPAISSAPRPPCIQAARCSPEPGRRLLKAHVPCERVSTDARESASEPRQAIGRDKLPNRKARRENRTELLVPWNPGRQQARLSGSTTSERSCSSVWRQHSCCSRSHPNSCVKKQSTALCAVCAVKSSHRKVHQMFRKASGSLP